MPQKKEEKKRKKLYFVFFSVKFINLCYIVFLKILRNIEHECKYHICQKIYLFCHNKYYPSGTVWNRRVLNFKQLLNQGGGLSLAYTWLCLLEIISLYVRVYVWMYVCFIRLLIATTSWLHDCKEQYLGKISDICRTSLH